MIAFEHEGEKWFVLAPPLGAFLHRLAEALVRGENGL